MANDNNRKYTPLTTPVVKTGFANINRESKFGGYRLDLFFDKNKENEDFFNMLEQTHDLNMEHERTENGQKKSNARDFQNGQVKDSDPDQFKDGDFLVLRLKTASRPNMFDSQSNPIDLNHELPIGSDVRVKFTLASYNFGNNIGTSSYLNDIQIVNMPERKQGDSGFQKVDGGFLGVGSTDSLTLD